MADKKRKYSKEEVQKLFTGRIYFNKDDLNIIVKRKSPFSYTFNMANKWSWVIMAVCAGLIIALVNIIITLFS